MEYKNPHNIHLLSQVFGPAKSQISPPTSQRTEDLRKRVLAAIGFANIANCFDKDGMLRNLEDMPSRVSAALETYKIERDLSGRIKSCHIKLHNKISALDALMKHTGGYQPHNAQKQTGRVVVYIPDNGRNDNIR